ncbi:TetR/AcrR family transcriptional regulator [Stutzerimonas chloritidismutans]|uniref:TetR/AcrR family transcriptional regulator n=1 Tax=Stutzerimonas chloritidismutans TaxID=203192 RepID=UPI003F190305
MSKLESIKLNAVRMIANAGFEGMSLRDLAAECNLKPGSIYCHYKSKQSILAEIVEEYLETLLTSWRDYKRKPVSPSKRLLLFVENYVAFQSMRSDEQRVLLWDMRSLHPGEYRRSAALLEEYRSELSKLLDAGQRQGSFAIQDAYVTSRLIVMVMMSMCVYAKQEAVPDDTLVKLIWQAVLGLSGARLVQNN